MLLLVLAYGDLIGAMHQNVRSHEYRIAEQAGIHVLRLLANLVLERGGTLQLAHIGVHAQQERQFGYLRHVALNIYRSDIGVETCRQVLRQHVFHVFVQNRRVRMRGQRVVVGNKKEAACLVLHHYEILQRSEVIDKMQLAGRANST